MNTVINFPWVVGGGGRVLPKVFGGVGGLVL